MTLIVKFQFDDPKLGDFERPRYELLRKNTILDLVPDGGFSRVRVWWDGGDMIDVTCGDTDYHRHVIPLHKSLVDEWGNSEDRSPFRVRLAVFRSPEDAATYDLGDINLWLL